MSTLPENLSAQTVSLTARSLALLSSIARPLLWFAHAIGHRRNVQAMLEMDERALKDIGLTRNDVLGALGAPLAQDPSRILHLRSIERRARQRAAMVIPTRQAQGVRA
jgi:uncharacterized protein YjiS (DUF1127 family)